MEEITLRSIAIGFVIFLLSVVISAVALNFQVDPFIAHTVIMAKLIGDLGSAGKASQYLSSVPYFGWQGATNYLIQSEYGAGVLLAILHLVSGGSITQLTYLPIPGMVSISMIYLILRRLSKLINSRLRALNLVFSLVAILSMYSYVLSNVVGRFSAFDFHGINNALYLMCLYFIIRLSDPKSRGPSYLLAFIMAFGASSIIHYSVPVMLIGDLAVYVAFSWLVSRRDMMMRRLPLILVVISSMQSFYFNVLYEVNIPQVRTHLIQYLSGSFLLSGFGARMATQGSNLSYQVQTLLVKSYTYSTIFFVVALSVFLIRGRRTLPLIGAAYSLTVGGSIVYFLSYFVAYGYGAFGFIDGWLLQPLLIVTVAMVWAGRRLEERTGEKTGYVSNDGAQGSWRQRTRGLVLAALLILASLQAGYFTLSESGRLSHGPMVSEPALESANLQSFLITHLSGRYFLIGASSEVSSTLFSRLADYSDEKVLTVLTSYITGNSTFTGNTLLTYGQLRNDFNYLILTKYELSNGLYGGATSAQAWEYLNATQVINLKSVLDSKQNLVYDSGDAYLYALN
jgi:uncharacterized membrane protein